MTRMGKRRGAYRVLVRRIGERDHLQERDVDGSSRKGVGHAEVYMPQNRDR